MNDKTGIMEARSSGFARLDNEKRVVTRRCSIGSGQGPAVIAMMWKAAAAINLKRSSRM